MATLAASAFGNLHFDNTLGALYVGNLISAVLFGVTTIQTTTYFSHAMKDGVALKIFVAYPTIVQRMASIYLPHIFRWALNFRILDLFHLAVFSSAFYFYSITNYGNPLVLFSITWSFVAEILVTIIGNTIVQGIFVHRLWRLSNKNYFLAVPMVIMMIFIDVTGLSQKMLHFLISTYYLICLFFSNIVLTVQVIKTPSFLKADRYTTILLYSSLGAASVSDAIVTGSLCLLLGFKKPGFKSTQAIIRMIIVYSINAGILTCLCAIASVITYAAMPTNFIFIAIFSIHPKLYLNSLLASLNARWVFQKIKPAKSDHMSLPISNLQFVTQGGQPTTESSEVVDIHDHHNTKSHLSDKAAQRSFLDRFERDTEA